MMKIETIEVTKLKSNNGQIDGLSSNPRFLKDDKFKKLVKSVQDDPEMLELREIIAYDNNGELVVICGNQRLAVLKHLKIKQAKVKVLPSDTSIEKLKAYTIKDNVPFGEHDWDILANEWETEQLEEWGLDIPLFEGVEELEAEEDEFDVPDGGIETDIVVGDLFEIGEHRLLCGDSTDSDAVAKLMNGEKADMVFTDPPYNVDFKGQELSNTTKGGKTIHKHKGANTKHEEIKNDKLEDSDFKEFIKAVLNNVLIFNQGAWYFCFCDLKLDLILTPLKETGFNWKSIIIWKKNQATLSGKDYKSRYEPIIYGCPDNSFYGERYKQEDIWEFQRTLKNDLHPTMKPIPLIENAINNSSKTGMRVLDLFLGSGSTMVAAHQLKRKCYGMELDPKYCQVIVDRMIKLDPTLEVKRNGVKYERLEPVE